MNSCIKNSVIFTVFGCNKLILFLLQKFANLLNVMLYFVLVVFIHSADLIACASDEIDVVDKTRSSFIGHDLKFWTEWMFLFSSRKFEVSTVNDYRW